MPLFEYRCAKCGSVFEYLVRGGVDKPDACPRCGGRSVERQFSVFSAGKAPTGYSCSTGDSGGCGTGTCPTGTCPFSS